MYFFFIFFTLSELIVLFPNIKQLESVILYLFEQSRDRFSSNQPLFDSLLTVQQMNPSR